MPKIYLYTVIFGTLSLKNKFVLARLIFYPYLIILERYIINIIIIYIYNISITIYMYFVIYNYLNIYQYIHFNIL